VISHRETRRRLAVDRERLIACMRERALPVGRVGLSHAFACVFLYRYSRLCFERGWKRRARILWQLNMFLTGADISPISDLGEGLLIVHPMAVILVGSAGKRLLVEGTGGCGGGLALEDIGAGPGLPSMGDDVSLARGAMVLGPVRIGSRVFIGPGCTVVRDLPDDTRVSSPPIRIRAA
jgi:serine O-acetyltransferase